MHKTALLLIILAGCPSRKVSTSAEQELEPIIGEKVNCLQVAKDEGFLCRSVSGHNYYCPRDADIDCSFTLRLQLLDAPAEKPK